MDLALLLLVGFGVWALTRPREPRMEAPEVIPVSPILEKDVVYISEETVPPIRRTQPPIPTSVYVPPETIHPMEFGQVDVIDETPSRLEVEADLGHPIQSSMDLDALLQYVNSINPFIEFPIIKHFPTRNVVVDLQAYTNAYNYYIELRRVNEGITSWNPFVEVRDMGPGLVYVAFKGNQRAELASTDRFEKLVRSAIQAPIDIYKDYSHVV